MIIKFRSIFHIIPQGYSKRGTEAVHYLTLPNISNEYDQSNIFLQNLLAKINLFLILSKVPQFESELFFRKLS